MRPDSPLRHAKHIVRAGMLLVAGVLLLVLGRSLFVPDTWGQFGEYRGSNVAEQMAVPVRHGDNFACAECHADESETLADSGHSSLACEACHAPMALHATDGAKIGDMPVRKDQKLCLDCHLHLDARPSGHPQIHPKKHVEEQGGEPGDSCWECHEAHEPI